VNFLFSSNYSLRTRDVKTYYSRYLLANLIVIYLLQPAKWKCLQNGKKSKKVPYNSTTVSSHKLSKFLMT